MRVLLVVGQQLIELGLDPLALFALQNLEDAVESNRLRRDVDNALKQGLENVVIQHK